MNLGFLGALSDHNLSPEAKEALDGIDVLFVPIGAGEVLDPAIAHKLSVQFGAKLVIPSHYDIGDKNSLKTFLKEAGEESSKPVDKLTLKKKDLEGKDGEVVVLEIV